MLHILLWMLKILGILLAALLAVLLFVFVCVLFVPVRYRIAAEGKLGGEQPVRVGVNVSWLLHIIRVSAFYPKKAGTDAGTGIGIKVRILCFTVFDTAKKKKTEKKQEKREKKEKKQKVPEGGESMPDAGNKEDTGHMEGSASSECTEDGQNREDKPSEPSEGGIPAAGEEPQDSENTGQAPENGGVPNGIWGKLKAFADRENAASQSIQVPFAGRNG